ncbi:hypothetical protein L0657_02235 [Dyadobacter sp. CY345]|uniref:hypothetical protein n=1 Tax=Dyadobacter sp. CY345 TaxID=2909335 RepID=UPI001F22D5CB|nr:hypothetical protein [Dyadobacter sp. CY345]MCF2442759.1 hypothetical protein [Dyadobacter sp. CY345]
MRFLKSNFGIIAITCLMGWMAFREYKLPKEPGENLYIFYLSTGVILIVLLVMIYFKHYRGKAN